jgi:hypothetical protein
MRVLQVMGIPYEPGRAWSDAFFDVGAYNWIRAGRDPMPRAAATFENHYRISSRRHCSARKIQKGASGHSWLYFPNINPHT